MSLLAPSGRLVNFGKASGNPDLNIEPGTLMAGNKGLPGYSFSNLRQNDPASLARTARLAIGLLTQGQLRVPSTRIFALEQAGLAHQCLESTSNTGKVLLKMGF